jgi:hypothetical protein
MFHKQGAHDYTKQYFSTVEPRTQAAPVTVVSAQLELIQKFHIVRRFWQLHVENVQ